MRELTVRIRFTKACLGNVNCRQRNGLFLLPRNPQGYVTFLASWHRANVRFAAQLLGRHQDEVSKVLWDIQVDGAVRREQYRRYYRAGANGRLRYSLHEAFFAGQVVGIHCVVPAAVADEDFWRLMAMAGQYKGLSPFRPGEFGFFEVIELLPRRARPEEEQPPPAADVAGRARVQTDERLASSPETKTAGS